MITTKYAKNDVSINGGEQNAFTIKANSKAFHTLISGLYADKIQSITREIWSNALDSHIAAGCPNIPFEVTFPSIFEPTFRVRDYGVGLAHKDVMGLYTTVFESTKENTNSQVGSFGLGSKSPFAYTDTFSVISVKNGEKNYYTALLNEDRIPTITHLHSEIVDEPNGVEVSFPVHKGDVHAFREAANKVSLGFDVKPIVKDGPTFKWPSDYSDHFYNGVYVKMGCVIYPVDVKVLKEAIASGNYESEGLEQEFIEQARSQTLNIFEVPIGSIEVSVSREALSYGRNEPTIPTLIKKFSKYRKNIAKTLGRVINLCKNRRSAWYLLTRPDMVFTVADDSIGLDEKHVFRQWCPLIYPAYAASRHSSYYSGNKAVLATYNGKQIPVNYGIWTNIKGMYHNWYSTKKSTAIMPSIDRNEFMSLTYGGIHDKKINFILIDRNERREGHKSVNSDTIKMRNAIQFLADPYKESNYDMTNYVFDPSLKDVMDSRSILIEFWDDNPDEKIRFLNTVESLLDEDEYQFIDLMSVEIPKKKRAARSAREKLTLADKISKYKLDIYSNDGYYDTISLSRYVMVENDYMSYYTKPEDNHSADYIKTLYDSEHEFIVIPRYARFEEKAIYIKDNYDNSGRYFAEFVAKVYKKNVIVIAQSYVNNFCEYYQNSISIESDDFDWTDYVEGCREAVKKGVLYRKHSRDNVSQYYNYALNSSYEESYMKELTCEKSVYKDYLKICVDTKDTSCYGTTNTEDQALSLTRRFFNRFPMAIENDLKVALDPNNVDTKDDTVTKNALLLKEHYKKMLETYPLLPHLTSYPYNSGRDLVIEMAKYINIVDNSKGDKNAS